MYTHKENVSGSYQDGSRESTVIDIHNSGMEDVISELDGLVSKKQKYKQSSFCTEEFDTRKKNNVWPKMATRVLQSKLHQ